MIPDRVFGTILSGHLENSCKGREGLEWRCQIPYHLVVAVQCFIEQLLCHPAMLDATKRSDIAMLGVCPSLPLPHPQGSKTFAVV